MQPVFQVLLVIKKESFRKEVCLVGHSWLALGYKAWRTYRMKQGGTPGFKAGRD